MYELMLQYWQFTLVGVIILATGLATWIMGRSLAKEGRGIQFSVKEMPEMKPIPIKTYGAGFWKGIWIWLTVTRKWELTKDFIYKIDRRLYVIPKGFIFDGASVPKFFRSWLSPMGVLLIGGLVHDYGYKYETLLYTNLKNTVGVKDQKWMDETFRDININVNGFFAMNYLAYYALRLGGFLAWKKHRKNELRWEDSIHNR